MKEFHKKKSFIIKYERDKLFKRKHPSVEQTTSAIVLLLEQYKKYKGKKIYQNLLHSPATIDFKS